MLIPLRDHVLVAALDDPDTWYGSSLIVRPDSTKDRSDQGIVKSIGPEVRDIKVGDYVIFPPYGGILVNDPDEGDKLVLVKEASIISVVTPPVVIVDNVFYKDGEELVPITSEVLILMLRNAYHKQPRVVEMKQKWERRLDASQQ